MRTLVGAADPPEPSPAVVTLTVGSNTGNTTAAALTFTVRGVDLTPYLAAPDREPYRTTAIVERRRAIEG